MLPRPDQMTGEYKRKSLRNRIYFTFFFYLKAVSDAQGKMIPEAMFCQKPSGKRLRTGALLTLLNQL